MVSGDNTLYVIGRKLIWLILVPLVGCAQPLHRRQADMPTDPGETLPEWTFDAPYYFRPPADAAPKPATKPDPGYPTHYYVRNPVIMIDRPGNDMPVDRVPRIAVWWTNTNGCLWSRAGFFGLGQTHFPFVAGDDGDYGIRFVGPGIKESLTEETLPHRTYHLDTVSPAVSVTVEPVYPVFDPNEVIWVHWSAADRYLDEMPVRLAVCWSWENPDMLEYRRTEANTPQGAEDVLAARRLWHPLESEFDSTGVLAYTIPDHAAGEGFQFQVRAKDRAGNYGVGYSRVIFVSGSTGWNPPKPTTQPATESVAASATQPADLLTASMAKSASSTATTQPADMQTDKIDISFAQPTPIADSLIDLQAALPTTKPADSLLLP